jgi:hypothetical protein
MGLDNLWLGCPDQREKDSFTLGRFLNIAFGTHVLPSRSTFLVLEDVKLCLPSMPHKDNPLTSHSSTPALAP